MIKHLVMFKLASTDSDQRQANAAHIARALEDLRDLVGIRSLSVHQDLGAENHWDLVLVGAYSSVDALDAYQLNPRHVQAVEEINPLISDRAIVDYKEPAGGII